MRLYGWMNRMTIKGWNKVDFTQETGDKINAVWGHIGRNEDPKTAEKNNQRKDIRGLPLQVRMSLSGSPIHKLCIMQLFLNSLRRECVGYCHLTDEAHRE